MSPVQSEPSDLPLAALTSEQIYARMLSHLRREVQEVSPHPSATDPALHLLLKAFSKEMEEVHRAVKDTSERAYRTLLNRLLAVPRGPRPAQTVVHFEVATPGREIGPEVSLSCALQVTGEEGRPADLILRFCPRRTVSVGEFFVTAVLRCDPEGHASLEHLTPGAREAGLVTPHEWRTAKPGHALIYFCLEARTHGVQPAESEVFLYGPEEPVRRLLWGRWRLEGGDQVQPRRSPPLYFARGDVDPVDFDALMFRSDAPLRPGPYQHRFVRLPLPHLQREITPELAREAGEYLAGGAGERWWWRVEPAGAQPIDLSGLGFLTDAVEVEERKIMSLVEQINGLEDEEISLGVTFDQLTDIEEVITSDREVRFVSAESTALTPQETPCSYVLRPHQDGKTVTLHLRDARGARRSARIDIRFATSAGPLGNGIPPEMLSRLDRAWSGVAGAWALLPTTGGEAARRLKGDEEDVRGVLRHHGRAVTLRDYRDIAQGLGAGYLVSVKVEPGVRITPRGAQTCVEVRGIVKARELVSDLEREAARLLMERTLERKSPVGTAVAVRFEEEIS